jgi:hypothetical protein
MNIKFLVTAAALVLTAGCALDLCPAGYYDVGGGNCCPNGYVYVGGECWTAGDVANGQPKSDAVPVKPEPTENASK